MSCATSVHHGDIHSAVGVTIGFHHLISASISAIVSIVTVEGQKNAMT